MTFVKQVFIAIVQMYFQSSSKWVLRFRIYDTRCLHLSNCRSLFWSDRVTLVILRKFLTEVFSAIVQMYFQSFSGSFIGFKANYTLYLRFCWISNWSNFRSQFRSNHTTLVRLWLFFFLNNIFTAILQMHFQICFKWFLRTRFYETWCLLFCRI